jgi:restriction endonuclease Mrr
MPHRCHGAWAVTHLAQAGLLDRLARGVTQMTDRGIGVLSQYSDRVDMKVLHQFPEYQEFRARTKERKGQSAADTSMAGTTIREDLAVTGRQMLTVDGLQATSTPLRGCRLVLGR